MTISEIIAEIQANPRSVAAYRQFAKYFSSIGKNNEAKAILMLIEKKIYGPNDPNNNSKQ